MAVQAGGSKFQCSLSLRMLRNIHVRRSIPLRAQKVMKRIPHNLYSKNDFFAVNFSIYAVETFKNSLPVLLSIYRSKRCVFLPKMRNWHLEYSNFKRVAPFLPLKFHKLNQDKSFVSRPPQELKIYVQIVDSDWSFFSKDNQNNRGQNYPF